MISLWKKKENINTPFLPLSLLQDPKKNKQWKAMNTEPWIETGNQLLMQAASLTYSSVDAL